MNFQITQGTGTTIGSDQVTGTHFQDIKLIDSTIGSSAPIGVAANPLKVSLEFTNSNTNPLLINGTVNPTLPFDRAGSGIIAAPADVFVFDCTGVSTLGWTTSGNWIGTMTHEIQYGDGQWFIVETIDTNLAGDGKPFVVTQWTEGLNNDPWITNVAGATQIRFRYVSYTSGSATVTVNGSIGANAVRVYNLNASILQTTARMNDGAGNALTSTAFGPKQALDVNIAGGVTIDVNLDHTTDNVLVYGNDGTNDQKIKTDVSGNVQVGVTNFPATTAVTQSGIWSVGRTWTLGSGTDSVTAIQGTSPWVVSLASTTITGTVAVTQSTSPWVVSGTVTANIGSTNGLALDSTVSGLQVTQGSTTSGQHGTLTLGAVTTVAPTYTTAQSSPLSLTLAGALRVDGSGVTQPVSGVGNFTVTQATGTNLHTVVDSGSITVANATLAVTQSGAWTTGRTWTLASGTDSISSVQSGTWTVQPGNTPNTSPWLMTINQGGNSATVTAANALKIDGSAVTQPISAVSLPLPTLAATSTKQSDGSQKTQVVDGANATVGPVQTVSGTNYLPVVQASSGTTGSAVPARSTLVGGSDGTNLRTIATDTNGQVKVDLFDGAGNAVTSTAVSTQRPLDINPIQSPESYAASQNQVFAASFDFNLPNAGTETPALFIKNPNGSGKTLVIKRILVSGVATGNNEAVAIIYSDPTTAANGSAQAATTTSIGSGATAVATVFAGPTVVGGANGARFINFQVPAAGNNTPTGSPLQVDGLVRIAPNHTLLITGKPAANGMNVGWSIIWQEI